MLDVEKQVTALFSTLWSLAEGGAAAIKRRYEGVNPEVNIDCTGGADKKKSLLSSERCKYISTV